MKNFTKLEKIQSESRSRNRRFEEIPYLGETHTLEDVKDVVRNFVKNSRFH